MPGYRFGCFEADLQRRTLRANDRPVELAFRHFEALLALLEAGGGVVSRDDLHRRLWPDAIVDDTSLNKALSHLRKALAERDPSTEYIETVPRRGYRLAVAASPIEGTAPARRPRPLLRTAAAALTVAILSGAGWAGWGAWRARERTEQWERLRAEGNRLMREKQYAMAAERFKAAIDLAPGAGMAYGELAHAVHRMGDARTDPATALDLARKGADLAPACAPCQGTLGFYLFYHAWKWEEAEERYEIALKLDPENSGVRSSYAFLLAATGRLAQAQKQADLATQADPLSTGRHAARASVLYVNRRYEEAIQAADRALALDRTRMEAWDYRSRAQLMLGRTEEAVRSMLAERYKSESEAVSKAVEQGAGEAGLRKLLEITGGWRDRIDVSWRRAAWLAALGEDEAALDALEDAAGIRNVNLMFVAVEPLYDRLHGNPRFEKVLEEMGLAQILRRDPPAAR